jgi:hypothetical protein
MNSVRFRDRYRTYITRMELFYHYYITNPLSSQVLPNISPSARVPAVNSIERIEP